MKNKNLFQKIAFAALLFSFASAIIAQTAPKQEKLLNGLKVLMWSDAKADKVTVRIRIHAGSAFDPQGKEGVMQLLADNIFPNEASKEFFSEDLGGGLEVIANYDFIQVNASSKPEEFLTMLETLSTAVSNPTIDKDTTAKLRAALLTKLKALESDPAYVADKAVAKRLFGTFPYGRPQLGTTISVQKLDFADLLDAKSRFLTADNATMTITGNFDKAQAFKAARRYFGGWLKADKRVPSTFRQPDDPATELQTVASPKPGTTAIRFALRGTSRSDKDFAASQVFSTILEIRLKARVPSIDLSNGFVRCDAHILPGIITAGFSSSIGRIGKGTGEIDANELVVKAMSEVVTEAEFQTVRSNNVVEWSRRDVDLFWLDKDTYKTLSVESDRLAFESLTLANLRVFAEKLRTATMVSVLVDTPYAAN